MKQENYYIIERKDKDLHIRNWEEEKNPYSKEDLPKNIKQIYSNFFQDFILNKDKKLDQANQILIKKTLIREISDKFFTTNLDLSMTLLARFENSVTMTKDQENYYNSLSDDSSKLYFFFNAQYVDYMEVLWDNNFKEANEVFADLIDVLEKTFSQLPIVSIHETLELIEGLSDVNLDLYYSYIPYLNINKE